MSRVSLQKVRSLRECPGRRTITRPRGGGHVENQTGQLYVIGTAIGAGALGVGFGAGVGYHRRRDYPHVLGNIVLVVGGERHGGQRRVCEQRSHSLSRTVRDT